MSTPSHLADLIERLSGARMLCIGDVMLDRYVMGEVERISPEAPIPVLRVSDERTMLGGAGNVINNIAALGGRGRFLSATGEDEAREEIARLLHLLDGIDAELLADPDRHSTLKTRFVGGAQQLMRADFESAAPLPPALEAELLGHAIAAVAVADVVLLSDYGKGVLTDQIVADVIDAAKLAGRTVIVDPKGRDYSRYRGASLITPNKKELMDATGLPAGTDAEVVRACEHLIETCDIDGVLATRSADGMSLVIKGQEPQHLSAQAREVYDVSGAGDTVVATLGLALAAGAKPIDAARLANAAAGIVVGKSGTATVSGMELSRALHQQDLDTAEAKLTDLDRAQMTVASWRDQGLRVGFTNGCFDLLHPGHISLLTQARAECDRLVVGLNSDSSVRGLKGDSRPVQSEAARATVLGALAAVDLVVLFSEQTPLHLIEALRPDILVKGADYTIDTVVGADIVQGYGGKVVLAQLLDGHSTTNTIKRIDA